jgi:threonine synthase
LYPHQGISRFQEAQMLSYQSEHMKSIALEGNFDDCQKL